MCTVERVVSRGDFAQCHLLDVTVMPRGGVGCTDSGTQRDVVGWQRTSMIYDVSRI